MNPEYIWKIALGHLEREMLRLLFNRWVRDTHVIFSYDGLFWIGTSDPFARDWLEKHLTVAASQVLSAILNRSVRIRFIVEEPTTDLPRSRSEEWRDITPLPDDLVQKYGIWVAVVAGKIWKVRQTSDLDRANPSDLAYELRMSRKMITRAIRILVKAGYVVDLAPKNRPRSHVYAPTNRLGPFEPIEVK